MSWLCVTQVAEIISDVREPIMEASQLVDENESRRQQVQVGQTLPTESTQEQLDSVILSNHRTVFFVFGWMKTPHIGTVHDLIR